MMLIFFSSLNCKKEENANNSSDIQVSEFASKEYKTALKQAKENNPKGLLKLYKIASDDLTYTVEYSEIARESLIYFLYSKTELWIRTFSKVEFSEFKTYLSKTGLGVSELPERVTSDEQFEKAIADNLKKIKGDKKEIELIDYVLKLIKGNQSD